MIFIVRALQKLFKLQTKNNRDYFHQEMKLMVDNYSIKYFYLCTQYKDAVPFNKHNIVQEQT